MDECRDDAGLFWPRAFEKVALMMLESGADVAATADEAKAKTDQWEEDAAAAIVYRTVQERPHLARVIKGPRGVELIDALMTVEHFGPVPEAEEVIGEFPEVSPIWARAAMLAFWAVVMKEVK